MKFDITPEEALPTAQKLFGRLKKQGARPVIEIAAWKDAPYRTTLHTKEGEAVILYEVQGRLSFHERIDSFSQWIAAKRRYAELHLVSKGESATTAELYTQLKEAGVGLLLLMEDDKFVQSLDAKNAALQVTPHPDLRYGDINSEVTDCIDKFNDGKRKDGLRDLFEIAERETERVLIVASRKKWISVPEKTVEAKDWSDQINTLASQNVTLAGRCALIDAKVKDDLHSFRGARNLFDHKVRSKREDQKRHRQAAERMMMGTRLLADLVSLRRKIR